MSAASAYDLLAPPIRHALWDMHWEALRPIQVAAIHTVLTTDKDALITARTASGKTEAAFLPALSSLCSQPPAAIGIVYVGPLKALINDQFGRIEILCGRSDIAVHRWHGDVDQAKKARSLKNPSGVMLITPESLEAFFVNRPETIARTFAGLRFVVIDEVHSMLGHERGTQLRSLLFRLQAKLPEPFRIVALSATVGDSVDEYRDWIRPGEPHRVTHLHDPGEQKRVLYGIRAFRMEKPAAPPDEIEADGTEPDVPEDMVRAVVNEFRGKKNLIFVNDRRRVEWLGDALNEECRSQKIPEEFLVHHGSISKEVREEAEARMRGTTPATIVCSSTLEMGIDIGNCWSVGQVGACFSVNSLAQRLGRSGRRDDEPHRMRVMLPIESPRPEDVLVKRIFPELLRAIALTHLMSERWYEPPPSAGCDFSTLTQQVLSKLRETGGTTAANLFEELCLHGAFHSVNKSDFADLLRGLGKRELIEQYERLLILTPPGERVTSDRGFYAAFAVAQELIVRHVGQAIGSVSVMFAPAPNDHLILAGRRWQVESIDATRGEISVVPAKGKKAPKFEGRLGDIHPRVHEVMQEVIESDASYPWLDPTGHEILAQSRRAWQSSVHAGGWSIAGERGCCWFPWCGTKVLKTLAALAGASGIAAKVRDPAIEFSASPHEVIDGLQEAAKEIVDENDLANIVPPIPMRKFDEYLSEELLRRSLATDFYDLDSARSLIGVLSETQPKLPQAFGAATDPTIEHECVESDGGDEESEHRVDSSFARPTIPENHAHAAYHSALPSVEAQSPLNEVDFVALDLETTGFNPVSARIVEFAAVRFRLDGSVIDQLTQLVDPGISMPSKAIAVHGISDDMVRGKPRLDDVIDKWIDFFERHPAIIVGHNVAFDQGFLSAAGQMRGLELPPHPTVDSQRLVQLAHPRLPNYRLEIVARWLEVQSHHGHRALPDALTLHQVFLRLLARLPQVSTTGQLIELAGGPRLDQPAFDPAESSPETEPILEALVSGASLRFVYRSGVRDIRLREATPLQIFRQNGRTYMSAVCSLTGETKNFRVDRLRNIRVIM